MFKYYIKPEKVSSCTLSESEVILITATTQPYLSSCISRHDLTIKLTKYKTNPKTDNFSTLN